MIAPRSLAAMAGWYLAKGTRRPASRGLLAAPARACVGRALLLVCGLAGPVSAQADPLPRGRWYLHEIRVVRSARDDIDRTLQITVRGDRMEVIDTIRIGDTVLSAFRREVALDGSPTVDTIGGSPTMMIQRTVSQSGGKVRLEELTTSGPARGVTLTEEFARVGDALEITRRIEGAGASEAVHVLRRTPFRRPAASRALGQARAESWRLAGAYFAELVQAMPAERFAFKAASEQRTFAEVVLHVASVLKLQAAGLWGLRPTVTTDTSGLRKEDYVVAVRDAFSYAADRVSEVRDDQWHQVIPWASRMLEATVLSKVRVEGVMRDHMAHDRGLLIAYLRLNGITPPAYVGA